MTKNKKIIISVIIGILLLIVVVGGTIAGMNLINNKNNSKTKTAPTTKTVNDLRAKAEKARASGDKTDAKTLLTQAQQDLKELPKTDTNTNTRVDIEAQLWLLSHSSTGQ